MVRYATAAPASPTVRHAIRGSMNSEISSSAVSVISVMYSPLMTNALTDLGILS